MRVFWSLVGGCNLLCDTSRLHARIHKLQAFQYSLPIALREAELNLETYLRTAEPSSDRTNSVVGGGNKAEKTLNTYRRVPASNLRPAWLGSLVSC